MFLFPSPVCRSIAASNFRVHPTVLPQCQCFASISAGQDRACIGPIWQCGSKGQRKVKAAALHRASSGLSRDRSEPGVHFAGWSTCSKVAREADDK